MVNSSPPFPVEDQDAWPWAFDGLAFGFIIGLDKLKKTEAQMRACAARIARINNIPTVPNLKVTLYLKPGVIAFLNERHHRKSKRAKKSNPSETGGDS